MLSSWKIARTASATSGSSRPTARQLLLSQLPSCSKASRLEPAHLHTVVLVVVLSDPSAVITQRVALA